MPSIRAAMASVLAMLAATSQAGPGGQSEILRAERQRVTQVHENMNAILESTPGGGKTLQRLGVRRLESTDRGSGNAPPKPTPAEQLDRDPFVVTPQLRARTPGSPGYIKSMPGMALGDAPIMLLKGLAGEPGRRVAMLDVKDQGLLRVREGETFQVAGGQAFRVKLIRDDEVVLETGHAETQFLVVR